MTRFDDAVVGAGVLGLATAWQLAKRGRRVLLIERTARAEGASVRNFGMLWPIGQPEGPPRKLAERSLALWKELLPAAGLWFDPCGSLHLAHAKDEATVLGEFIDQARRNGRPVEWLGPEEVCRRSSCVNPTDLVGGMFSPSECCVDPRQVIRELPGWLSRTFGVSVHTCSTALAWSSGQLRTSSETFTADRLWLCTGADFQAFYPDLLHRAGLRRCKLQMLRTTPVPQRLGPMLAGGLTLGHYTAFAQCPSLPALKERFAHELPDYGCYGIHVMAAQNGLGELVLGDSHEYGDEIDLFDKPEIDRLILAYLSRLMTWPRSGVEIAARWHGIYAKHPTASFLVEQPEPDVTVINGVGGAGMTLSQGLAEQTVNQVLGTTT